MLPATAPTALDSVIDAYGRLMRALVVARAVRGVPWEDLHITLPQARAMCLLAAREQGVSGRELAALLRVSPSAITPLIDRLVEQGFVRRAEDREDRRITRLFVTSTGLAVVERMVAGQRELMRDVLSRLDPDELALVDRALALLQASADQVAHPASAQPLS